MLAKVYGSITKKSLLNKASIVQERFNNANFKAKRSGYPQKLIGWR